MFIIISITRKRDVGASIHLRTGSSWREPCRHIRYLNVYRFLPCITTKISISINNLILILIHISVRRILFGRPISIAKIPVMCEGTIIKTNKSKIEGGLTSADCCSGYLYVRSFNLQLTGYCYFAIRMLRHNRRCDLPLQQSGGLSLLFHPIPPEASHRQSPNNVFLLRHYC